MYVDIFFVPFNICIFALWWVLLINFFAFYCRNERVLMQPQFVRGDLIALSVLQENAVIESGAPYIIDTKSIGFIFRNVYERGDKYECKVSNPKKSVGGYKYRKKRCD